MYATQVTRLIEADPEQVFALWTEPERLCRWWGPKATAAVDLRPGGAWRLGMDYPGVGPMAARGIYQEVGPFRLVFTFGWEGEAELHSTVTVELVRRGALTEMVLTHAGFPTEAMAAEHKQGWSDCLDRLVLAAANP